jgi:hypothetical protein
LSRVDLQRFAEMLVYEMVSRAELLRQNGALAPGQESKE